MSNFTLVLFQSQSTVTGAETNTTFSTAPMRVVDANAAEVFRYDHTPIAFTNGHCHGDNYEYASTIPFDIDNSHSDNPEDWVHPNEIGNRLTELGINFVMVASRNHLLPKEKDGVVHEARPKFHAYLPLSKPERDSDRFVRYCKWCIKTFDSDEKVKSKSQKMFGYRLLGRSLLHGVEWLSIRFHLLSRKCLLTNRTRHRH